MRIEELKIYAFDELSKEAQAKAVNDYRQETFWFLFSIELEETLKAVSKVINCNYKLYSYEGVKYQVTLNSKEDDEVLNLEGVRAFKFIYNNYIDIYIKGKYLKHYKNKAVYSKVIFNYDCPFTGVCFDMVLFNTFEDFTKLIKNGENLTVQDFIDLVAVNYSEVWTESNEYELSYDFIKEEIINNDFEFLEDGKMY